MNIRSLILNLNFLLVSLVMTLFFSPPLFADQIRLGLNWKPEPQFGGFYAASKLGFFKDKSLTVQILEGGSGTPTIQMLAAGQVDYAIVSADEVILAHDRGSKDIIALYAAYQTNPQGILVHAERNFGFLEDVFKSDGTLLWQAGLPYAQFLNKKYARISKVKTAPYLGGIGNFQNDPKISQQCFVTSEPLLAEKAGLKVKTFLVADSGYNPYTTVLVTKASRLKDKTLEVQKMVQAIRAGWHSYQKNPDETNKLMAGLNKAMDVASMKASWKAQLSLIEPFPELPDKLGTMELSRWEILIDQLADLKLIKTKPKATDLFQNL